MEERNEKQKILDGRKEGKMGKYQMGKRKKK